MLKLILAAALWLPPTPVPASDCGVAAARATWGTPTPAGYQFGGSIGIARGFQEVTGKLDLTGCFGARLTGSALAAVVYVSPTADVPVTLDLTGSFECIVENLTIRADEHGGYALKLARRPDGASAGDHRFVNCTFEGPVLNEGSEGNSFVSCIFNGSVSAPALTLRNGTPKPYGSTMQSQDFVNCRFNSYSGQPAIVLQVEANNVLTDISFSGGQIATAGGGEAAVTLRTGGTPDRQMKMIHFANMRWETADRTCAVLVKGTNGVAALSMQRITTHQTESIVRAEAALYGCMFEDVHTTGPDTHYAIDAPLVPDKNYVRLPYAWGFKATTRP